MRGILRHTAAAFMVLVLGAAFPGGAPAKTTWVDKNVYSSSENLQVGDILSVRINDVSNLRFSISASDTSGFTVTARPDSTLTGFLPKVSADKKVAGQDKTEMSERGSMTLVMGSRVTRKNQDGTFELTGTREYSFNGVANRFTVSGVIDATSVKGRTVLSSDIANFRLEIRGQKEGAGLEFRRAALKEKETAKADMTEEEKQRIIIDYLNKILKELTR
ncbi:MAG: hypothetical protein EPN93_06370 [Spirochaetes bacterium]|nr:MAG: hypothetical protein EPN93_06370 [Spirochaetota bacterium]